MKSKIHTLSILALILIINACATYKPQYKNENTKAVFPNKAIAHSFYLIGDAGNSPLGTSSEALKAFKTALNKASKNSTALFLGDNIYPKGMPDKDEKGYDFAAHQLNIQTDAVKDFKGETVFIPGNHDWYNNGLEGLKRQEQYIEDKLGKDTFLLENGCPIERVKISDEVVMIVIDSEWYLTNWNRHPTINDDCEIKTRDKFFEEFESLIKKARGKTTIVALHHPMFTNGSHGGQYSFGSHMSPIPVLGTLKNIIRKTGGVTTVDIQNKLYNQFRKRLITLSQKNDKTIFVSGHDHNLQYIVQDNLPQIVSGSGSKTMATRNVDGGEFSYGAPGYARLDVFKDGSSYVRFYSTKSDEIVFQTEVIAPAQVTSKSNFNTNFPKKATASIYSEEETTKGGIYKAFWGARYREAFSKKVTVPTVNLDTLFGGLTPVRKGGGNQSKSIRLEDKQGREYVMRALRKNALQYLQAVAFKDQYIEGQFDDTYTEGLLLDVFTGSHPYAPFAIATLADAVGVYHTNPVLYYIPKQNALGTFNDEFGDELYMIEERAADGHGDKASFGFSNELISTDDLLKELNKDEDIVLDEATYIRARLFDMLIGDWDRHEDQWRWAKFEENKKTVYRPVPRDRDQAFSIMADGALLSLATTILPSLRLMKSYDDDLKSPKWFNLEPYPLDMALINQSNRDVWNAQVKHIVDNLTDDVIDEAFTYFPPEVNQETVKEIKLKLKGRRSNLQKISDNYYNHINKFAIIKGTNKDDWFKVERLPKGNTKVTAYRIKKGKKADVFHERTYTAKDTKEIWIYGLDDDDRFDVLGKGSQFIKVRLIGGQNKDTYNIENGKKVKLYDYKTKTSTFITNKGHKKLTDDYETNVYDYKKLKNSSNQFIPTLGSNPDDGFKIGFSNTITNYGFERNPFTSQHTISAAYYFATQGFLLNYKVEFANIINDWNLQVAGKFTTENYTYNFFGYGNETTNTNDDLDFNRVKTSIYAAKAGLVKKGRFGSDYGVKTIFEGIEIGDTPDRFISTFAPILNTDFYKRRFFGGLEAEYKYKSFDNDVSPTNGMAFLFNIGGKTELKGIKNTFGYINSNLGFYNALSKNKKLVLKTGVKTQIRMGDDLLFYHASNIGGDNGLRGYRTERFTGKNSFVGNADLRYGFPAFKTNIVPLQIGVFVGTDVGRVWLKNEDSNKWHNDYGGGFWVAAADSLSGTFNFFNSTEGFRFSFGFGLNF